jgi:hypothetical protein
LKDLNDIEAWLEQEEQKLIQLYRSGQPPYARIQPKNLQSPPTPPPLQMSRWALFGIVTLLLSLGTIAFFPRIQSQQSPAVSSEVPASESTTTELATTEFATAESVTTAQPGDMAVSVVESSLPSAQSDHASDHSNKSQLQSHQTESFSEPSLGLVVSAPLAQPTPLSPWHQILDRATQAANLTQTAQSPADWHQVIDHWQGAITRLETLPNNNQDNNNQDSTFVEQKLELYHQNLAYAQEQLNRATLPFPQAVREATQAAQLTQTAQSQAQWSQVVAHWQRALECMKQIPTTDPNYDIAQNRLVTYQQNVTYAQQQAAKASP